jgi:hypothetical protein
MPWGLAWLLPHLEKAGVAAQVPKMGASRSPRNIRSLSLRAEGAPQDAEVTKCPPPGRAPWPLVIDSRQTFAAL